MSNEDYLIPDPWGYKTNPEDKKRKNKILEVLDRFPRFERALDIGAGEGWITQDLPAEVKHAFEQSERAKSRLPEGVLPIKEPFGKYDLIIATGVLYDRYDLRNFYKLMREHSSKIILTCNISEWEDREVSECCRALDFLNGKQVYSEVFPYREYRQQLRVFEI